MSEVSHTEPTPPLPIYAATFVAIAPESLDAVGCILLRFRRQVAAANRNLRVILVVETDVTTYINCYKCCLHGQ